jgi:hypothetical protein
LIVLFESITQTTTTMSYTTYTNGRYTVKYSSSNESESGFVFEHFDNAWHKLYAVKPKPEPTVSPEQQLELEYRVRNDPKTADRFAEYRRIIDGWKQAREHLFSGNN